MPQRKLLIDHPHLGQIHLSLEQEQQQRAHVAQVTQVAVSVGNIGKGKAGARNNSLAGPVPLRGETQGS